MMPTIAGDRNSSQRARACRAKVRDKSVNEDNRGLSIMDKPTSLKSDLPTHGASILPSVTVDSYNIEVRDEGGFIGDKASKGAFCRRQ